MPNTVSFQEPLLRLAAVPERGAAPARSGQQRAATVLDGRPLLAKASWPQLGIRHGERHRPLDILLLPLGTAGEDGAKGLIPAGESRCVRRMGSWWRSLEATVRWKSAEEFHPEDLGQISTALAVGVGCCAWASWSRNWLTRFGASPAARTVRRTPRRRPRLRDAGSRPTTGVLVLSVIVCGEEATRALILRRPRTPLHPAQLTVAAPRRSGLRGSGDCGQLAVCCGSAVCASA